VTEDPHLGRGEGQHLLAYLPTRERKLLEHALGCSRCQVRLHQVLELEPEPLLPSVLMGSEYGAVVDQVEAGLAEAAERLDAEREQAEAAVEHLLGLAPDARRLRIRAEARFRTVPVAHLLVTQAMAAAAESPEESRDLAVLALFTLGELSAEQGPAEAAGELKVRAWAVVTRAAWVRGEWNLVRDALECAEEVMVTEGFITRRAGFRRAVARLRLAERRTEATVAAAARAVDELLRPFFPEFRQWVVRNEEES
jgi:hypothetical protein